MDITFIEGVALSQLCDYSFGDQASVICSVPGGWMKPANLDNHEFIEKVKLISQSRNYMTLFIDNIRLYSRPIRVSNPNDQNWLDNLMMINDLLKLCASISHMKFIIFCNLEDTPIDEYIHDKVPNNVLRIYSSNAIYNNDKVKPFPYGIQRRMNSGNTKASLKNVISANIEPSKLLYVNHNISTNVKERSGIYEIFESYSWASVDRNRLSHEDFFRNIKQHKFVICPIGNAIDCHRNWEVLYLSRVPVMKKNSYLELLFKDFPVLFVNEYSDITQEMLEKNETLYHNALNIDMDLLDLNLVFNGIIENEIKDLEINSKKL